jgi:hypothetical protein
MVVGMSNGLFLAGCALAPDGLLVALLLFAGASFGLINSNLNAITQTLAGPQAAGRWMGALQWGLVVGSVETVVWKRKMKLSISGIARRLHEPSAHIR